jgi:hypothetical protein
LQTVEEETHSKVANANKSLQRNPTTRFQTVEEEGLVNDKLGLGNRESREVSCNLPHVDFQTHIIGEKPTGKGEEGRIWINRSNIDRRDKGPQFFVELNACRCVQ